MNIGEEIVNKTLENQTQRVAYNARPGQDCPRVAMEA